MHALTILQPWASLIMAGFKTKETRSWGTPHRGPLVIHASKSERGLEWAAQQLSLAAFLTEHPLPLPLGCILGTVELTAITPLSAPLSLSDYGWLVDGPLVWHLEKPELWPPLPFRGQTGLWQYAP